MRTEVRNADQTRVRPEHPHLPLVFMTVLTQLAAGAFCGVWLLAWLGRAANWNFTSLAALGIGLTALAASTLPLGRPLYPHPAPHISLPPSLPPRPPPFPTLPLL